MELLKKTLYLTIILLFSAIYSYSQCNDSVIPKKNYKLYDYYTGKSKLLLTPKNTRIILNNSDTIVSYEGRLLSLESNKAKLEYYSKELLLGYSKNAGYSYISYNTCKNITIPLEKIEYIEHDSRFSNSMAITAVAAALYGLVVAPLTGIPVEDETEFNGKRYINNLGVAAGIFAVSYTLYITFPKTKRYRTSPKMK